MGKKIIQKPPGIEDIFPDKIPEWNLIHNTARDVFRLYNYREIIIPVIEYTEVFSRGIGTETDIVSKEMFSFEDRGGRNLTLRPEGTASVVRAYVGNGEYNRLSSCRLFYSGPMFRAEKPQKGRQRQFNQFGAEFFGSENPFHDYEIISIMNDIAEKLNILDYSLLINSIGCIECRPGYIKELKSYYESRSGKLCEDCRKRLEKNPLRLLDCKEEGCNELKDSAPKIPFFICTECNDHFIKLKEYLGMNKTSYTEDPYLVRGLDYYTRTTFEFVSSALGGQDAFAAGGRYDNLVETFGGNPAPAVGFAAGVERIALLLEAKEASPDKLDVFIIHTGNEALAMAVELSILLRKKNFSVELDPDTKGFKAQFKKADRENAKTAIIIGDEEVKTKKFTVKDMATGEQKKTGQDKIVEYLRSHL